MLSKFVPGRLPPGMTVARYLQSTFGLERFEIARVLYDAVITGKFPCTLTSDTGLCEHLAGLVIARQDCPFDVLPHVYEHGVAHESLDWMQVIAHAIVDVIQNSDEAGFQRVVVHMNKENIWNQTPRLLQMIRQQVETATCALALLKVPSRYIWQRLYQTFFWNNSKQGLTRKTFAHMYKAAHASGNVSLRVFLDETVASSTKFSDEEQQEWFLLLAANGNAKFAKDFFLGNPRGKEPTSAKKYVTQEIKEEAIRLAASHGKLTMVKTLFQNVIIDKKLVFDTFVYAASRGHLGIFDWLGDEKACEDTITPEEWKLVLSMALWISVVTDHDRMHAEIKKFDDSPGMTPDGLSRLTKEYSNLTQAGKWEKPVVRAAIQAIPADKIPIILQNFISSSQSDGFYKVLSCVQQTDTKSIMANLSDTARCSYLFQWLWNRTENPSTDILTLEQIEFLTRDAVKYACIETFVRLAPKISQDAATDILKTVNEEKEGFVYKSLYVYFPMLFQQ